jgi:hypothetical protein
MSQKFQIIALLAMIGSFGSSDVVQAGVDCESFRGTKVTGCFANPGACYILAGEMLCHNRIPTPCSERTKLGQFECDSPSAKARYLHTNCQWGPVTRKIGEENVKTGERDVVIGKDKKGNNIMGKQDIMEKRDIKETKPECY